MARAAAKGGKRPQPDARRSAKSSGKRQLSQVEETLFFSRLRNHAKWMFVLLAVIFAGGFVFFGVGSGGGAGSGSLSDLFNNLFHGGSSGPSISSALAATQKRPNDAAAWKELATAYQSSGRTADAVAAWTTYASLRPKDAQGLAQLASLQATNAQALEQQAATAQAAQQNAYASSLFLPASTTALGRALSADPIQQLAQSQALASGNAARSQIAAALGGAVSTYQRLAALRPRDVSVQLELAQAATAAGNAPAAIAAYRKVARLEPSQAGRIRQLIAQLRRQSGTG